MHAFRMAMSLSARHVSFWGNAITCSPVISMRVFLYAVVAQFNTAVVRVCLLDPSPGHALTYRHARPGSFSEINRGQCRSAGIENRARMDQGRPRRGDGDGGADVGFRTAADRRAH